MKCLQYNCWIIKTTVFLSIKLIDLRFKCLFFLKRVWSILHFIMQFLCTMVDVFSMWRKQYYLLSIKSVCPNSADGPVGSHSGLGALTHWIQDPHKQMLNFWSMWFFLACAFVSQVLKDITAVNGHVQEIRVHFLQYQDAWVYNAFLVCIPDLY